MKQKYRIYVLGTIPPDLKERITAIHAAGILKGKIEDLPVRTQATKSQNGVPLLSVDGGVSFKDFLI